MTDPTREIDNIYSEKQREIWAFRDYLKSNEFRAKFGDMWGLMSKVEREYWKKKSWWWMVTTLNKKEDE